MTNSKQWELELEEYGSMHNEGCPCMLEDPDGCDCDMHGLKPLFRNAINQAVEESLSDMEVKMKGWHGHGDEMVRDYRNKLSIIKDKNEVAEEEEENK